MQASGHTLRWGRGYAAATVSGADVRAVMRRIHRLVDRPLPKSAPSRARPRSGRAGRRGRRAPPPVVDAHRPER
jgi:hypothetical protein